jgi:geranylgeranyl pyrophosphate synthase
MNLNEIYRPIKKEMFLVEKEIHAQTSTLIASHNSGYKKYFEQIIGYIFEIPGKLLRPALVLLSAKSVNGEEIENIEQLVKLAVAVEFVHSASLIHDDIIDSSDYRRNRLTLNKQFGNQIAVLVGDIFYSQFFSILIDIRGERNGQREKLLRSFSDITKKLCFGEIQEHKIRTDKQEVSFNDYLRVIEDKTASLFFASCMSGSLLNGADDSTCSAISRYGLCLGYTFQLVDDYIDDDSVFNSGRKMLDSANEYADKAKNEIVRLPESDAKKTLMRLPDLIISRTSLRGH